MTNFTSHPGSDEGAVSEPKDTESARALLTEAFREEGGGFVPLLLNAMKKHPDIAAAFAWLHAHERRDTDDNDAMVMLAALLEGSMFSQAQRRRSAKAAAGELQKALWDRSVPDEVKIHVLPLLAMAGQPVDDAAAGKFFQDYDGAMRRQSLAFASRLSDSPESLTKLLLVLQ